LIIDVPNFPKTGIVFKDITPLLANPAHLAVLIDRMAKQVPAGTTHLLAIESRGFILGAALAAKCHLGLLLARKPGKLPRKTLRHEYQLEYGTDALEIHADAIRPNDKILIVDDVLATGGTAHAAESLCRKAGGNVVGHSFLIELNALQGRNNLDAPVSYLFQF
jgi:adenine phosphoribosyltransferase